MMKNTKAITPIPKAEETMAKHNRRGSVGVPKVAMFWRVPNHSNSIPNLKKNKSNVQCKSN